MSRPSRTRIRPVAAVVAALALVLGQSLTATANGPAATTAGQGVAGPTGALQFEPSLDHQAVGDHWATRSNGYSGDVNSTAARPT